MNREHKRKLGLLAVLALALLVSGTFAFTAFNQQAINDRLRDNEVEVGGRVHDYYNRETENKDVFVENFGQEEIMARIRLSEFMEIQARGQTAFTPVVLGTSREDVSSWTTLLPSATSLDDRQGASDAFDEFSNLTFGWERDGQVAPWYLPTFNHVMDDERTAAAGHARDWAEVGGDEDSTAATDGTTDGTTHPGEGTDAYWSEGDEYNNSAGDWFGSQVTRETAQNLAQERPPMTLHEWEELPNAEKIGDFWVVDHETGWAYWASELSVGETTSYLLDAAEMTPEADAINGSYYYGIHVESNLISPDESFEDEPDTGYDGALGQLLEGIRNNGVDDEGNNGGGLPTENPDAGDDSPVNAFNFGLMNPGRLFTMAGTEYRYLENMGGGNHLIIRNDALRFVSWNDQESRLTSWYSDLPQEVRSIVAPVAPSFTVGMITFAESGRDEQGWLLNNIASNPVVASDVTQVVPIEDDGVKRAFALSLADVNRLSGPGLGFPNLAQRLGFGNSWWWTRTPSSAADAWYVFGAGPLGSVNRIITFTNGGVRPALILHQAGT